MSEDEQQELIQAAREAFSRDKIYSANISQAWRARERELARQAAQKGRAAARRNT